MINDLDAAVQFNVLFLADGYKSKLISKVVPEAGDLKVTLEPTPPLPDDPARIVRGRIEGLVGMPIADAEVSLKMVYFKRGVGTSNTKGMEPICFTNRTGDFVIVGREPLASVDFQVSAPWYARTYFSEVRAGGELQTLRLKSGVTVRGRLVKDGKPVPDALLGLIQLNRGVRQFVGEYTIGTNADGVFEFTHLGENEYALAAKHESIHALGCTPMRPVTVKGENTTLEIDDLGIVPGLQLRGTLHLTDNPTALPTGSHLVINREDAWESITLEPNERGAFELKQLAPAPYVIIVRVPGYRLTRDNPNLDIYNPHQLVGTMRRDISSYHIVLEPGGELDPERRAQMDRSAEFNSAKP